MICFRKPTDGKVFWKHGRGVETITTSSVNQRLSCVNNTGYVIYY